MKLHPYVGIILNAVVMTVAGAVAAIAAPLVWVLR